MRKSGLIAGGILLLAVALAGGWYALSPGWTLKAMVDAAEAGNGEAFSAYVDYSALRADMKSELDAKLDAQAKKDNSAQGRLSVVVSKALLGPMVDRLVSPPAIEGAFKQLADIRARQDGTKPAPPAGGGKADARKMPEIRRDGFNRFLVVSPEQPDSGLVFERRGLGWRLTGIDLPEESAGVPGRS